MALPFLANLSSRRLGIGNRVRLAGGHEMEPRWLKGRSASFGECVDFIPGNNGDSAAVIHLDEPITFDGMTGSYLALRLRYAGARWTHRGSVHVELFTAPPGSLQLSSSTGLWIESHATYWIESPNSSSALRTALIQASDAKESSLKAVLYAFLALAVAATLFLLMPTQLSAAHGSQEEADNSTVFVFIKIPESIMPIERGEKYENPLDDALKKAGAGEVTGGGSQLGNPDGEGQRHIEWVGIDVDLTDFSQGLPLLKSELKRLDAPVGTTLEYEINGENVSEEL